MLLRPCAGWVTPAWHGANPLQHGLAPSTLGWSYGNPQLPPLLRFTVLTAPGTALKRCLELQVVHMLMSCTCHLQTGLPCSPKPAKSLPPVLGLSCARVTSNRTSGGDGGRVAAMCATRTSGSGCATPILQDQAPQVPPVTGGEHPGDACFPFTHAHGSQKTHTRQISHFQPKPWLSRGTKGCSFLPPPSQAGRLPFPSPWHRWELPLPIHLIKTTSLLWGCRVLHPSCALAICLGWQLIWESGAG